MESKNVFITGGAGFVGAHLAKSLLEKGTNVVVLQHDLKRRSYLNLLGIAKDVNIVLGDINDYELLRRIFVNYEPDYLFHLAAVSIVSKALKYPTTTYRINAVGTSNLLEVCFLSKLPSSAILIVSTDKVYGEQVNVAEDASLLCEGIYETSKACEELVARAYLKTFHLPIVVSRACNIFGLDPYNRRIVPNIIMSILRGENPVIYMGEDSCREYIYVKDAVDAYIKLTENISITCGNTYNIGTGYVLSQEEMVLKIADLAKECLDINVKPGYVNRGYPLSEIKRQSMNSKKIYRDIGWKPKYSLEEGLKETIYAFQDCLLSGNL
ncbi:MAG: dTDP-glucose 4,6-dehydratase [Candidatus Bathyarchaeota archaeon BA2]|nr:MAG: dTDP-glucose 4,6-dehydratase [Candidatus Bathyarchaeota archaeon BA2]